MRNRKISIFGILTKNVFIGKIRKKGKLVIPKRIREKFGIHPGDVLVFEIQADKIIITKIKEKMSEILEKSQLVEDSITFQRKLREEWE